MGRSFRLFFHSWLARVVVVPDEDLCSDLLKVLFVFEKIQMFTLSILNFYPLMLRDFLGVVSTGNPKKLESIYNLDDK